MKRKVLTMLLAVCLVIGCLPLSALAAESGNIPKSSCQWALSDDGTLTISGKGSLELAFSVQYDAETDTYCPNTPWYPYRDRIKRGIIEEGIDLYQALYVFMGCENLVSVQLPSDAREISPGFFKNCKSLTSVEIPSTANAVGYEAFAGCESLQSLTLSEGIARIDEWAFTDCSALASLTIPAGAGGFSLNAFRVCKNLQDIYYLGTEEQWAKIDASGLRNATVHYEGEPTYTVTFNANGGSVSPAEKTVQKTKEYGALPVPVKGGTRFLGWYTAKEGGERIDQYTIVSLTANQTLYAHWSEGSSALSPAKGKQPVESSNIFNNQYQWNWSSPVKSYLYENDIGGFTRVEYVNNKVIVEEYDSNFQLQANLTIQPELPIWGGFFSGESYNFLIYGQTNHNEDNGAEVVRIVKYDKGWNRLGQASLRGANTTVPFDAGSLRCAEAGAYLYIHTCHEMYKSSDGLNHQANLTLSVRQDPLEVTSCRFNVLNTSVGYVSHSFNQFVLVNQENRLVTLDHGDAYPRAIALIETQLPADRGEIAVGFQSGEVCSLREVLKFSGKTGDNYTGAEVGGFAETSSGYIVAYTYNGGSSGGDPAVYCQYVGKEGAAGTSVKLSKAAGTNPQIAATGLSGGYILWNGKNNENTLYYAGYSNGGGVGAVKTAQAPLSDCQPVVSNGKTVWYVTEDSAPTFYLLDSNGKLEKVQAWEKENASFTDVPENAYYHNAVQWALENGITSGTSKTTFSPNAICTRAQAVAFLWRSAGSPEPASARNPFTDVKSSAYYYKAVQWAVENGITSGTSKTTFSPGGKCSRAEIVTFLNRFAGNPPPLSTGNSFADVPTGAYYYKSVLWAAENGITAGTSATAFSPKQTCTRAQIVTFLYRYNDRFGE